ncbi:hypothetical protein BKA82DRAFT_1003683 [Pisolithus tinctorius]|nr:hypothetical protein BKA82DRAFT_1003683 [Pisolithus tinctorius]
MGPLSSGPRPMRCTRNWLMVCCLRAQSHQHRSCCVLQILHLSHIALVICVCRRPSIRALAERPTGFAFGRLGYA